MLARAQIALEEPAADIARTLDQYAALLERTGFHLCRLSYRMLRREFALADESLEELVDIQRVAVRRLFAQMASPAGTAIVAQLALGKARGKRVNRLDAR